MTGLPSIVYSWNSVEALHVAVLTMNVAGLMIVALAIIWTARLARGFANHLNLVAPAMILLAVVLCLPTYVLGIKAALRLRSFAADKEGEAKRQQRRQQQQQLGQRENKEKEESRQDVENNRILYLHVLMCLVSGGVVAGATAVSILRSSIFQRKIRDGLIEAIGIYGIDINAKIRVDAIQMKFKCCGSNGYTDWFRVPWMKLSQADFLLDTDELSTLQTEDQSTLEDGDGDGDGDGDEDADADENNGSSASADVPFSCCSLDIPRPCIHRDILKASIAYGYDPERGLTISTKGCRSEIIAYGRLLGYAIVVFLTLLFVYQSVLCLLSRFLQTAHRNAYYIGPRRACYCVWILGGVLPKAADDRRDTPSSSETVSLMLDRGVAVATEESKAQFLRKIRSNLTSVGTSRSPTEATNNDSLPLRKRDPPHEEEHPQGESEEPLVGMFGFGKKKATNRFSSERQDKETNTSTRELSRVPSKVVAPLPPPLPQSPREFKDDGPPPFATKDRQNFNDQQTEIQPMKTMDDGKNEEIETREYDCRWSYPKQRRETAGADIRSNFFLTTPSPPPPFKCCKASCIYPDYNGTEDSGEIGYNIDTRRICETQSRVLSKFDPADAYDRFRGTLQDTLARREGKLSEGRTKKTRWTWRKFVGDSSLARTSRISRKFGCHRCTSNFPGTKVSSSPHPHLPPPPPPPFPPFPSSRNPVLPPPHLMTTTTIAERLGVAPWVRSGNECRDFLAGFRFPRPV